MENCLVTTLKGVVDNDNLLKIGEMRIFIHQLDSPSETTQKFTIKTSGAVILTPIGGTIGTSYGSLSTSPITVNNAEQTVYFSNSNFYIKVSDKYLITQIVKGGRYANVGVDVNELAYSALVKLTLASPYVEGSLAAFKNTSITDLIIATSSVKGSLKDISSLPIGVLNVSDTTIAGSLSDISSMNTLGTLYTTNTGITGNLNSLPKNIINAELNSLISGSINDMTGYSKLQNCSMPKGITGALETLAQNLATAGNNKKNVKITFNDFLCTLNGNPITSYTVYIHLDGSTPTIDYTQKA